MAKKPAPTVDLDEIDPGHIYQLLAIDGVKEQTLTFVKRFDPDDPTKYPGNRNAYPGTTMQSVLLALIKRIDYVQNQIPHINNLSIKHNLVCCLWLLEERAALRHGYKFDLLPSDMLRMPLCPHCGHMVCTRLGNAKRSK